MSTPTTPATTSATPRHGYPTPRLAPGRSGTLAQVIRSEWTKLWSLRSTGWTLLATFVVTVGFSALASWGTASNLSQSRARGAGVLDVTTIALAGILFGQLPLAVLGALSIGGEYSTGAIKATLAAVPQRLRLLLAKGIVFTAVAGVVGMITTFASFYAGMIFFHAHNVGVSLGAPHVLRAVIGGGLMLIAAGLLGFAIGTLLRYPAGAITVSVALLFVIPIVLQAIPADIVQSIHKYFLGSAAGGLTQTVATPDTLGPWVGYLIFLAEIAAVMVAAAILMTRRDA